MVLSCSLGRVAFAIRKRLNYRRFGLKTFYLDNFGTDPCRLAAAVSHEKQLFIIEYLDNVSPWMLENAFNSALRDQGTAFRVNVIQPQRVTYRGTPLYYWAMVRVRLPGIADL
jgi:hypothetical protein